MSTRRSFRRPIAVAASIGLAGALTWLPAGPASATAAAHFIAEGNLNTASACTLTTGDDQPSSPGLTFAKGTRTQSVDLNATSTNTSDSTDTVAAIGHYSTSMTIAKQAGDLKKMSVTGHGSVNVIAALGTGSLCNPQAFVDLFAQFLFTEAHPGWLYVTRNTVPKQGIALTAVSDEATGRAVALDLWQGGGSSAVSRGFVTPGTFGGEIAVGLTAGDVVPIVPFKAPQKSTIVVAYHRAGSALAVTSGSGKRFVSFPGSISCSSRTAKLTWRSGASKVASGTFSVNGSKKASVSNPRAGHHVVLRHLSKTADNKITVKLSLKGGGHASAGRLYVPCSA